MGQGNKYSWAEVISKGPDCLVCRSALHYLLEYTIKDIKQHNLDGKEQGQVSKGQDGDLGQVSTTDRARQSQAGQGLEDDTISKKGGLEPTYYPVTNI